MEVHLKDAEETVDQLERILLEAGISIPKHAQTGADMLSIWQLLKKVKEGFSGNADDIRLEFTAAVAMHDFASKVIEASKYFGLEKLKPHLSLLADGAIHLTEVPEVPNDTYNKLIELYWACLCMSQGLKVDIDSPTSATGTNPDVLILGEDDRPIRAYAFKTIYSPHTQSVYEHIVKGIDQIERSEAQEGIVALHLTPHIAKFNVWPTGGYYNDYEPVVNLVRKELVERVSAVVRDNGQLAINQMFKDKKAVDRILCVAFCPIVAESPVTGKPTVMPLKVAILVELDTGKEMSEDFICEIVKANEAMQCNLL